MTLKEQFTEYIRLRNEADKILGAIIEQAATEPDVEVIPIGEAAKLLHKTTQTVRVWANQGRLRKIGRNITVDSLKQLAAGAARR